MSVSGFQPGRSSGIVDYSFEQRLKKLEAKFARGKNVVTFVESNVAAIRFKHELGVIPVSFLATVEANTEIVATFSELTATEVTVTCYTVNGTKKTGEVHFAWLAIA